ncbi:MAG: disulfide bond formation protein B [Rhizobiales bacterium]|nr:disulfide bond formation protein B [Hyphomicrobiales bacterium]
MTARRIALLLFLGSLSVILAAWGFEVIGGFQPCGLCLQQRLPYYVGVPLAAMLFAVTLQHPSSMFYRRARAGFFVLAAIFAFSLYLAIRHAGVEWGFWLGPANCATGDIADFGQGGSLLEQLQSAKVAYCDQAAGRFLGLSFAGWNAVASLGLLALALLGALKGNRRPA